VLVAEMMNKLQFRTLTNRTLNPYSYKPKKISVVPNVLGEKISDYDLYRVSNDSSEREAAVSKAIKSVGAGSNLKADSGSLFVGVISGQDITRSDDMSVLCSEVINKFYGGKMGDSRDGEAFTSYDLFKYQETIKRPEGKQWR